MFHIQFENGGKKNTRSAHFQFSREACLVEKKKIHVVEKLKLSHIHFIGHLLFLCGLLVSADKRLVDDPRPLQWWAITGGPHNPHFQTTLLPIFPP